MEMKKMLALAAVAAMTSVGFADSDGDQFIYWMVDEKKVDSSVGSYDAAFLWTVDSATGEKLVSLDETYRDVGTQTAPHWTSERVTTDLTGLGLGVGSKFLIELSQWDETADGGNGAWVFAGASGIYNYTDVVSLWTGGSGVPEQKLFSPAFMVPEPTSGLLMLLGIAGLALRRKRA